MPPIWEYRAGGYRPASRLSRDLGLVARYVGIDLLFTTSPLYDPLVTAPDVGGSKVAHVAMLEDDADEQRPEIHRCRLHEARAAAFEPYYPWKVGLTDTKPVDAGAKRALDIFTGNLGRRRLLERVRHAVRAAVLLFHANLDDIHPDLSPARLRRRNIRLQHERRQLGDQFGLLGFADDNWVDGTQTHVFMFDAPEYRALGFGFTTTGIHEFGHHVGMSHPHDGYDSEEELDFDRAVSSSSRGRRRERHRHALPGAVERLRVFDRDNQYRWEMAGYLNWSNAVGATSGASEGESVWPSSWPRTSRRGNARRVQALGLPRRRHRGQAGLLAAGAGRPQIGARCPTLNAARRALPGRLVARDGCRIRQPVRLKLPPDTTRQWK